MLKTENTGLFLHKSLNPHEVLKKYFLNFNPLYASSVKLAFHQMHSRTVGLGCWAGLCRYGFQAIDYFYGQFWVPPAGDVR